MFSRVKSCTLMGLEGDIVNCEADLQNAQPSFQIVGLPDTAIRESVQRIRAAIKNSDINFPPKRIIVNLSPANLPKDGSQMDLAIAIAILSARGIVSFEEEEYIVMGELSLDGRVNPVTGALPMVISMREKGFKKFIIPEKNKDECACISDVEIFPVSSLNEVIDFLNGRINIERYIGKYEEEEIDYEVDFSDIKGQHFLKRGLEIAAAGKHNLLMIGVPGSGKSMAAKRFPTILPSLSFDEAIEVTKIYSIAGLLDDNSLVRIPPFRAPHHTASAVSLIGGGRIPKPGEISLAHNGVLYLDELPEFNKNVIEVLRQPLEDKKINISRANTSLTYPAKFMFIASMNPCPCGYYGSDVHECRCTMAEINRYLSKISHPLLDRIDIHIEITAVKFEDISKKSKEESSAEIKKRVEKAREIQRKRFKNENYKSNSEIRDNQIDKYCKLSKECKELMNLAFKKYKFSARTYNKVLKVARTISDLGESEEITRESLLESIRFRLNSSSRYFGE